MSPYAEETNLGRALHELCQDTGARSGILQAGTILIEHNLSIPDSRVHELTHSVDEMMGAYETVGRSVETAFFAFSDSVLVVVSGGTLRATLAFSRTSDKFNEAIVSCRRFLRMNRSNMLLAGSLAIRDTLAALPTAEPEPVFEPEPVAEIRIWDDFRPQLKAVLSRVLNSAQADRVIDDMLKIIAPNGPLPNAEIRNISREVINQVPNVGKRGSLLAEISDIIEDYDIP